MFFIYIYKRNSESLTNMLMSVIYSNTFRTMNINTNAYMGLLVSVLITTNLL